VAGFGDAGKIGGIERPWPLAGGVNFSVLLIFLSKKTINGKL
jgi:hypothetical protein